MSAPRWITTCLSCLSLLIIFTSLAFAADPATPTTAASTPDGAIGDAFNILVKLALLSVVVEVAFTTLFTWKWYLIYLHDKGWKVPIVVVTTFLLCKDLNLDIFGQLVEVLFGKSPNTNLGLFLTSLLLAGGSSSFYTLFTKLNIRNPTEVEERARRLREEMEAKPPETWPQDSRTAPNSN